ncbi:MAG: pyruvate formate lyase family protein [Candidatus Bathyarchaeia archaeon]
MRIKKMKEKVLRIPQICIERVRWFTESYKETEGQPPIIRKARALKKLFENMPIDIEDEELLVGKTTSKTRGGLICMELRNWVLDELDKLPTREQDPFLITEEEKSFLREALHYWKGKCAYDMLISSIPESIIRNITSRRRNFLEAHVMPSVTGAYNIHAIHQYDKVLIKGINGIKKEIDQEIAKLDLRKIDDYEKYLFYEAAKISLDAIIILANRYSELARKKAATESDLKRKAELERIAEICSWVPANPARNFHEALQSIWLVHIGLRNEGCITIGFGRLDQYLYPFYKKDIEEKRITEEEARELIAEFLIKLNDCASLRPLSIAQLSPGYPIWPNIDIGGGKDEINDLSYIIMEMDAELGLPGTEICIHVNEKTPDDFLRKAIECLKKCKGKFKFFGDETIINRLIQMGVPLERAKNFGIAGCASPAVCGCTVNNIAFVVDLLECLELALNNGAYRNTGEIVGPRTGDPRKFRSFEEVLEAFKKQVEYYLSLQVIVRNIEAKIIAAYFPTPLSSSLLEDCIKRGKDIYSGGALLMTEAIDVHSLSNTADALAAIKKLVFEEKIITMEELIDALDNNFKYYEHILHMINQCPKFGNDDDYVDSIMKELIDYVEALTKKYQPFMFANAKCVAISLAGAAAHIGRLLGATPDGRKAGEPTTEAGLSPHHGRNILGPVATLRSVIKVGPERLHGCVLNMKFNPNALKDEIKIKKFISMLKTYFKMGGFHVQFNIVDAATLREAQRNPQKYGDLLVRVATWTARFVELAPEVQNEIIARTEFHEIV